MKNADFILTQENLQWLIDSINQYLDKEETLSSREQKFNELYELQTSLVRKIVSDI